MLFWTPAHHNYWKALKFWDGVFCSEVQVIVVTCGQQFEESTILCGDSVSGTVTCMTDDSFGGPQFTLSSTAIEQVRLEVECSLLCETSFRCQCICNGALLYFWFSRSTSTCISKGGEGDNAQFLSWYKELLRKLDKKHAPSAMKLLVRSILENWDLRNECKTWFVALEA